jgi:hypothetical protein
MQAVNSDGYNTHNFREKANLRWQAADDTLRVRGAFKAHEYGDVILPFVPYQIPE